MKEIELPIKSADARARLGVGASMFSAIKSKMGLRNSHRVLLSAVMKWMHENPNFRERDVYHRPSCTCQACAERRANVNHKYRGRGRVTAGGMEQAAV